MDKAHIAETTSKVAGYAIGFAKALVPEPARPAMTNLFDKATNTAERIAGWREELTPPLRIRLHIGPFLDPRLYRLTGDRNVAAFRDLAGLRPDAKFLDIGCGCGRVARALTKYLGPRSMYEGFDASLKPVEWCQREITPRFPNFRFRTTNTFNKRYNPLGMSDASTLVFPYADATFDFVFVGSIYTHMLPEEVENYLSETARVLKPGGKSFATFCLLNERTLPVVEAGASMPRLPYRWRDQFRVRHLTDPAHFIAQPEPFIRTLHSKAGLKIAEPISYGTWAVVTGESSALESYHLGGSPSTKASQDAVIATKE